MSRSSKKTVLVLGVLLVLTAMATAPPRATAAHQPPPGQEEFVPIDELPPEEQLPAAPLLVAAYGFIWIFLLLYIWSLWRRLARVEREIADVAQRVRNRT